MTLHVVHIHFLQCMHINFPVRRSPTRIPLCCTFFIIKLKHSLSAIQCMLVSYLRTSPFHPLQNYYTLSNRQVIGNCLKGCSDENNWCVGHGMLGIYHRKENNKILENFIQEKKTLTQVQMYFHVYYTYAREINDTWLVPIIKGNQ